MSPLRRQKEDCRNGDKTEIGTYGKFKGGNRVITGQQDDNARYCILKVLNTRGQHLQLGKNVPLGQAEPLRGPHPRVPEWTSPVPGRGTGPRIQSVL
jgi:hypothetical protein